MNKTWNIQTKKEKTIWKYNFKHVFDGGKFYVPFLCGLLWHKIFHELSIITSKIIKISKYPSRRRVPGGELEWKISSSTVKAL